MLENTSGSESLDMGPTVCSEGSFSRAMGMGVWFLNTFYLLKRRQYWWQPQLTLLARLIGNCRIIPAEYMIKCVSGYTDLMNSWNVQYLRKEPWFNCCMNIYQALNTTTDVGRLIKYTPQTSRAWNLHWRVKLFNYQIQSCTASQLHCANVEMISCEIFSECDRLYWNLHRDFLNGWMASSTYNSISKTETWYLSRKASVSGLSEWVWFNAYLNSIPITTLCGVGGAA